MILNRSGLDAAAAGFRALFFETLQSMPAGQWQEASLRVDSDGANESYNFMAELPSVREFLDEREVQRLRAETFTLANRDWEDTVVVHKNELRDDKLGIIRPRIQGLAEEMMRHRDTLYWDTVTGGTAVTGYDGEYFISATHPRDNGLADQSNTGASALTSDNFNTAVAQMMGITDRQGRPLGIVPTHLFCGLAYRVQALKICNALSLPTTAGTAAETNINQGAVIPIIDARISGNNWGLMALGRSVKPYVFQIREEPEFHALDDPSSSERAFMRNEYLYGGSASHACAGALWQLVYLNTGP